MGGVGGGNSCENVLFVNPIFMTNDENVRSARFCGCGRRRPMRKCIAVEWFMN